MNFAVAQAMKAAISSCRTCTKSPGKGITNALLSGASFFLLDRNGGTAEEAVLLDACHAFGRDLDFMGLIPKPSYVPARRPGEHLQVIAITNFKGGSGKTTTTAHLVRKAQVRLAQAAMANRDTSVAELCRELGASLIREGWISRTHVLDACASLGLAGALAHLEDLVRHDAAIDLRAPIHDLTRAHAVLRTRRGSPG